MHRVELKEGENFCIWNAKVKFLMHRVELKADKSASRISSYSLTVPNAPCGVESFSVEGYSNINTSS